MKKKNACSTGDTVKQAAENGSVCETAQLSTKNDTTSPAGRQILVVGLRRRTREVETPATAIERSEPT